MNRIERILGENVQLIALTGTKLVVVVKFI